MGDVILIKRKVKLEFRDEGIRASNCSVPLRENGHGSALNNDVA